MKTAIVVIPGREYRNHLRKLLENHLGFLKVTEAENLGDACRQVEADLVLVELSAPDAGDDRRWGGLRFCHPAARLVVLFDEQPDLPLQLAFTAGATGFLPKKDVSDEILAERLRDVMQGIRVVPGTDFFERLGVVRAEAQPTADLARSDLLLEQLTPRERDILTLLAEGASNKEIAARLHLSEKTVWNRVSEILSKLKLRNRTQAAIWAREHGWAGDRV